jgi:ligand-binding sensor domain-containing protein
VKKILIHLFVLLLPLYPFAQFEPVQQFSVKDGLPSAVVYDCLQDKQGFMWFATAAGLARFDGTNFKVFTTKDGITNNEVLQIFLDDDGSIWIIPYGGKICIYDPQSNKILNSTNTPELGKIETIGDNVFFRNSAIGFVSCTLGNIIQLKNKTITITKMDSLLDFWPLNTDSAICFIMKNHHIDAYYFTGGRITNMGVSKNNIQWHHSSTTSEFGKIRVYNSLGTPNQLTIYRFSGKKSIEKMGKFRYPFQIHSTQKYGSEFYINTANGLFITDSVLNVKQYLFKGISISKSFSDRDGNEWFTTISGEGVLLRMKNGVFQYNKNNGLPHDNINAIGFDKRNRLFCGDAGGDLYSVQMAASVISTKMITRFSDPIRGIGIVNDTMVVFSTKQILTEENKRITLASAIKAVFPDTIGNLLIGCTRGLFIMKKNTTSLNLMNSIQTFRTFCYYAGRLFFGNNKGLYLVSSLYPYREEKIKQNLPLFNQPVNHLLATADGLLWVATNTAGIYALKEGRVMVHLQSDSGLTRLSSSICKKIFFEKTGKTLWVATNKGVNRIEYSVSGNSVRAIVSVIGTSEGLNDDDVNDICVNGGKVYAATIKGVCVFPENIQPRIIPMVITGIRIKNYELPDSLMEVKDEYKLNFRQNNISISFAGISFTGNRHLQYQYRFFSETGDTAWTTTNATSAEFGQLSPGRYTFQVKTGFGNIKQIRFNISTPFWKTNAFYFLMLLLAIGVVWMITRALVRNIRKKELEKTATNKKFSELELKALQAQMNPHFVFNAMNTLQNYILKHESEQANEYLGRFSRLMRLFLDASRNKFITIVKEVELLQHYIEIEQARLDTPFTYSIICDGAIDPDTEIPSVIIQPFVENAILHGLRHRHDNNGKLEIAFKLSENDIICVVTDNGIGREEAKKINIAKGTNYKSQGMQLIDEKIETLKAVVNFDIDIHTEDLFTNGMLSKTSVTIRLGNSNKHDTQHHTY